MMNDNIPWTVIIFIGLTFFMIGIVAVTFLVLGIPI
jgi:hypothetical protein